MQDSKYLVASGRYAQWGLVVNTVGYDEVDPDEPYPTRGHGDGYYFDVNRGRILDEYQMLYLVDGEYTFSSAHVKDVPIKAGDLFLLFPGEWHTLLFLARDAVEKLLDRLQGQEYGRPPEV